MRRTRPHHGLVVEFDARADQKKLTRAQCEIHRIVRSWLLEALRATGVRGTVFILGKEQQHENLPLCDSDSADDIGLDYRGLVSGSGRVPVPAIQRSDDLRRKSGPSGSAHKEQARVYRQYPRP